MGVRVVEIDAGAAIAMVDLAGTLAARRGVMLDALGADAGIRGVELFFADEECIVLRPEILAVGEIEGDAVGGAHRGEMAPLGPGFEVEDVGEEFGRGPSVLRRDDRVVELDTHLRSSSALPHSITSSACT